MNYCSKSCFSHCYIKFPSSIFRNTYIHEVYSSYLSSFSFFVKVQEEDTVPLDKPEFEGMWNKHKPYVVPKDADTGPRLPRGTKMEKVGI